MKKIVISLLVENTSGVLSRIAGLFSRRGYNIDSLTVGITQNPAFSRMTIVSSGEEDSLVQLRKQVEKLVDVVDVTELPEEASVYRELVLLKVELLPEERPQLMSVVDIFRARIVDVSEKSVIIELTGNKTKIEAFISLLGNFKVMQVARTGITGLMRGAYEK